MAVTLNDDEVSNHKSGSDEDRNFIALTAIAVVDENPYDGELSENANL